MKLLAFCFPVILIFRLTVARPTPALDRFRLENLKILPVSSGNGKRSPQEIAPINRLFQVSEFFGVKCSKLKLRIPYRVSM